MAKEMDGASSSYAYFMQQQYGNAITISAEGGLRLSGESTLSLMVACTDWAPKPFGGTNFTNRIQCNQYFMSEWNTTTNSCQTKCEWFTKFECNYTYGTPYCLWN
eukprot:PhF_6_TR36362/c1_g1_i1/m.53378